jgi:hypothetical protein
VAFSEAVAFAGVRLVGHQHVTDAYLLGLAVHRGGVLATLDRHLATLTEPKAPERKALETVGLAAPAGVRDRESHARRRYRPISMNF